MKYRAEIDGLRTIAVVPVILFHAGLGVFSGGFIGVDVFFVISGFLITTILVNDIERGSYSISGFYERRARRILPALFVVMAACIPFAWAWMGPTQFREFSRSLVGVSFFVSNIEFWRESGYFAPSSDFKPLLHTWSLAVEEQYYVFFPLFLAAAWRLRRGSVLWLIVFFAAVSLALSEWAWRNYPTANFYLAPTRVWELFAGAIAAFAAGKYGVRRNEPLSLLGLAAVIGSIFWFDSLIPMPSIWGLIPVLGVVLVLLFGTADTIAGRILSNRLFVGIGLVSYSAYLWHQPLLAFARIRTLGEPGLPLMLALAAISFGLAYLSWRFVEAPFRDRRGRVGRKAIFLMSGLGIALFALFGTLGMRSSAKLDAYSPEQREIFAYSTTRDDRLYGDGCFLGADKKPEGFSDTCFGKGKTVIWGDSHVAALSFGLSREIPGFGHYAAAACPPLMGRDRSSRPNCAAVNRYVFSRLEGSPPARVIIAAHWMLYDTNSLEPQLRSTITALKAAGVPQVIVLGSVPEFVPSLPELLIADGTGLSSAAMAHSSPAATDAVDRKVWHAAEAAGAEFVSLRALLCKLDSCRAVVQDPTVPGRRAFAPLTSDGSHLTAAGSSFLAGKLMQEPAFRNVQ